MSWLAVWLVGVGVADLVRAAAGTGRAGTRLAAVAGAGAVVVLVPLTALTAPVDLVVLAASLVPLVLWVRLSAAAVTTGSGEWPALASLAAGAAVPPGTPGAPRTGGTPTRSTLRCCVGTICLARCPTGRCDC